MVQMSGKRSMRDAHGNDQGGTFFRFIRRGLQEDRTEIVFPRLLYFMIRFVSFLPSWLVDARMARLAIDVPEARERERFLA
jgi:hypothetical protein